MSLGACGNLSVLTKEDDKSTNYLLAEDLKELNYVRYYGVGQLVPFLQAVNDSKASKKLLDWSTACFYDFEKDKMPTLAKGHEALTRLGGDFMIILHTRDIYPQITEVSKDKFEFQKELGLNCKFIYFFKY